MKLLLLFIVITLTVAVKLTEGSLCDDGWFGPDCQYKCRCTDNKCDDEGECTGGAWCEKGWFGPSCQYDDLSFSHSSDLTPWWLQDADDSTCNPDPTIEEVTLHLDKQYVLTWIQLHVNDPELLDSLEARSTLKRLRYGKKQPFIKMPKVDAHTIDLYSPPDLFQEIVVTGPGVKALCSVHISGGRNVAVRQNTTQSSVLDSLSGSWHAVDGSTNTNYTEGSCTETASDGSDTEPNWNVTFLQPKDLTILVIYGRRNGFLVQDLEMYSYDKQGNLLEQYWELVYNGYRNSHLATAVRETLPRYHISLFVRLYRPLLAVSVCEIEFYGDSLCEEGKYGRDCEHTCNCAVKEETCFVSTGGCPSGCAAGYQGENCQFPTFCTGTDIAKIDGKCLKLMDERVTWQEAKAACEELGPTVSLLELTSASVREYVQNITVALASRTWLGATDAATEGNWVWSSSGNKAEIDPSWWGQGQPDNSYGNENCLIMRPDEFLNDYGCNNRLPYFCQSVE